ncbi:MAG: hypothetical protein ACRED5_05055 [Propylenella sp.]
MTFDQRAAAAKPYITGFVIGVIAAPVIAFSAGWVSTSGARTQAVENARVQTLVNICSANAERIAAAQNTDLATLKGYNNREKRDELVAAALADFQVPDDISKKVMTVCNQTLA